MLEAGWLLLFLFLGLGSLVVVAVLWPSFRRATSYTDPLHLKGRAPATPRVTKTENTAQSVKLTIKRYLRSIGWRIACLGDENTGSKETNALLLMFSLEEIGAIVAMIVKGVERKQAVRAMPRYNRDQHREFAAFYTQLKSVLDEKLKEK